MTRILIVLTSHSALGDTGKQTGFHFEEFTTPYYALKDAGYAVDIASIAGGQPPYDPASLEKEPESWAESVTRFHADAEAKKQLAESYAIHQINAERYDAVFLAGGHGTMWDFAQSKTLADVIGALHSNGKLIASVCHGAAGLVDVRNHKTHMPIVQNVNINCFTDEEEREVGMDEIVPFLLESKLKELGATFQRGKAFSGFAVRDGQFITGQNPASLADLCDKLLTALKQQHQQAA